MSTPANPIGQASFTTSPDFNPIPLLSTGIEVVSRPGLAASGLGILYRGTILHIDPATAALTKPVVALDCNCVLSNDIDATLAAAPGIVYVHAKVKADALVYPGALPQGPCNDALRDYGIYVETVLQASGLDSGPTPFGSMADEAKTAHDPTKPHGHEPLGHEHGKHAEHHSEKDKK